MKFSKFQIDTLIRMGLAALISLVLVQFPLHSIEFTFFDMFMRLKPVSKVSGLVEIISIDENTIKGLGRQPAASEHIQLLNLLSNSEPKSIVYLIRPTEIQGTNQELKQLADKMRSISNSFVGQNAVELKGHEDFFRFPPPFEGIGSYGAPTTTDKESFAKDNVTRRMMVSFQSQPVMQARIAALIDPRVSDERNIRGTFEYLGSTQLYIDYRPSGTYPRRDLSEVLKTEFSPERYRGKVIFLGRDLQEVNDGYIRTPFSNQFYAMTISEAHANMLDTLVLNSGYLRAPSWIEFISAFLMSFLTVFVVLSMKPAIGIAILVGSLSLFLALAFLLFWTGHVWLGTAQTLLAAIVSYYLFLPYRLIIENRRSWEYYQKNKLLTQVEELKTNFLSMMSHDLKTPIARIQGMTDIVLKDPNPLSSRQKEALSTLAKSSQELLEFVSSILNLGRIESKELELHISSRDPNSLIKDAVNKLEYLATKKGIKIVAELEPLFSVRMDVDLIRQVFYNLIENAIKYSPENTRILITSEEVEGKVIIQVADQGQGIAEEDLPHVFSKFYRSKAAKSSPIKGSGLGLYLAKYFVELHRGRILVDSRLGVGTTFTVELPTTSDTPSKDSSATSAIQ